MKLYFSKPITSLEQAHQFFAQLQVDDLLFHPEDDPDQLISSLNGKRTFTPTEVVHVKARIAEVYTFDPDPCAFIMGKLLMT